MVAGRVGAKGSTNPCLVSADQVLARPVTLPGWSAVPRDRGARVPGTAAAGAPTCASPATTLPGLSPTGAPLRRALAPSLRLLPGPNQRPKAPPPRPFLSGSGRRAGPRPRAAWGPRTASSGPSPRPRVRSAVPLCGAAGSGTPVPGPPFLRGVCRPVGSVGSEARLRSRSHVSTGPYLPCAPTPAEREMSADHGRLSDPHPVSHPLFPHCKEFQEGGCFHPGRQGRTKQLTTHLGGV